MKEPSDKKKNFTRDSIIGLGEESFRKNYYPELQDKIRDLEKINARNRALISTIPDILLVSDMEGRISPFTLAAKNEDYIMNQFLRKPEIMAELSETARQVRESRSFFVKELKTEIDGHVFYFEARFHESETREILIMIRNMTEPTLMEYKLRDMAERDNLTNLYNRRSFEEKMAVYNGNNVERLAVISIDINGLKFINDTLGHYAGDSLIIESARLIKEVFEEYGGVYRIGGDEFGVIIENLDETSVEMLINTLLMKIDEYNHTSLNYTLSVAYGYNYHENGPVNMEYLFRSADNNMYQNKLLKKESTRGTFVKAFMKALEVKDYVSEGHVVRLEKLAVMIGEGLGLHQDQMDRLILLSKFHDIGKIGIPDSILKKPAKLTDDEWKVMRTHSTIGERIAMESSEIKDIAPLILHHHEKWDGTGYPEGLSGKDIPIECRIIAIEDSFDAMTNDRPYHKAMETEEAADEILLCSGTQYDPELVGIFYKIRDKIDI